MSFRVGIYGAGHLGRQIASEISPNSVFIDDTSSLIGRTIDNKPVMSLETFATRYSNSPHLVYLCICLPHHCVHGLIQQARGRTHEELKIVPFTDYFINHPGTKVMSHLLWDQSVFTDDYREIMFKIRSEFSDQASVDALDFFIQAQTHGLTLPSYISSQNDFSFLQSSINSRTHYIDGGAFDGDSIKQFVSLSGSSFRKITAIEPDDQNVRKLSAGISEFPDTIRRNIEIFPAAISSFSGQARFQAKGDSASCLSSTGQAIVNTIALKDLINESDLFIKLDIEGAERSSIKNALPTIGKYLPILAISVYHQSKDLVSIFEMLKSEVPAYSFAFRILGNNATDAMLYCYP